MTAIKFFIKRRLIGFVKLFGKNSNKAHLPSGSTSLARLKAGHKVLYHDNIPGYSRNPPVTVADIHKIFIENLNEPPQELFVVQGQNWYVWGNQGAVITNDYYLLGDVSREFDNKVHSVFNQFKLAEPTMGDGCSAVLAASGSFVYYHWMFDILPRIAILKQAVALNSIDNFIVNYLPNNYQTETLTRAGIDSSKIIPANDHWDFHVQMERLLVPSMASANDRPSLAACLYLRELYSRETATAGQPVNIYIQRQNGRTIINEVELLALLAPLNLQIIHPEDLSVAEQAALFSRAGLVIGAHGAGLTNIVFCKPGTIIIDLFSAEWINPCYWIIAEHLGLKYGYLEADCIKQKQKGKRAHIMVNLGKLKSLFSKLNIQYGE